MNTVLSSPNRVVWEYFFSLRLLVAQAREAPSAELCRQAAAMSIIMAVTVGEVFFNLWFRVRVEERHTAAEIQSFLRNLSPPYLSLDRKLRQWPQRYLGRPLDLSAGPGAAFVTLKNMRNAIVHFTSTHESLSLGGVTIHGLADTTEYDNLSHERASWALQTTENVVAEVFRLAGLSPESIPRAVHAWSGKVAV